MEQAEPLMLKRLQLSVSRLRGVLHWGLSPLSTSYKLSLLHSKNPPPTGGFTRLCVTIKAENSDYSFKFPSQTAVYWGVVYLVVWKEDAYTKIIQSLLLFFMIIFVNILKINVSKKQRNQEQNENEQKIILLYSYMTIHIKTPNLFIFIILSSSIENKY